MFGNAFRFMGAFFLDIFQTVVVALSIFLIMYLFLVQPHQVNGLSMYSTFDNGDLVLTDKISYKLGQPKRGDVVILHAPPDAHCPEGTGCDFIKRLIGLPGEKVEIKNSGIYIDGIKLPEPYIAEDNETLPGAFTENGAITLGPDEYFVCGDNRMHSSDSRTWGPIHKSDLVGRAFVRYWPLNKVNLVPQVEYHLEDAIHP